MPNKFGLSAKKIFLGKPISSKNIKNTLLPKIIALPVFASDALSSVAYAPNEVLFTLATAGLGATMFAPQVGVAVVLVLIVVVLSYTQNIKAYPSGGGNYEVVSTNLGKKAGLLVGASLLVDYFLTVAVSIASGTEYILSILPGLGSYKVLIAVCVVLFIMTMNLRGIKESGTFFAIPVYFFLISALCTLIAGFYFLVTGQLPMAQSSTFELVLAPDHMTSMFGLAGVFLFGHAFASGCAALTGVEAISNGVPSFRKPKIKNAQKTLLILGLISSVMMLSILFLANKTGIQYVEDPANTLYSNGVPVGASYNQAPVIGQLAQTFFAQVPFLPVLVSVATGLILFLAANTAFNGFPVLASVLAKDDYLPHYMRVRGDRLAYSNGIMILAAISGLLLVFFKANVSALIELYVLGVFVSFTLSQISMVIYWTKRLRLLAFAKKYNLKHSKKSDAKSKKESTSLEETKKILLEAFPKKKKDHGESYVVLMKGFLNSTIEELNKTAFKMNVSRVINVIGVLFTSTVLVIVVVSKFFRGAYISVLMIIFLFFLMFAIKRFYVKRKKTLQYNPKKDAETKDLKIEKIHAIVLVSGITKPLIRALKFARASNPDYLEALLVDVKSQDTKAVTRFWKKYSPSVKLHVLESEYRSVVAPIYTYIAEIQKNTDELVVVYIPEYIPERQQQRLLNNQTALKIRTSLMDFPKVIVATVPWRELNSVDVIDYKTFFPVNSVLDVHPERKERFTSNKIITGDEEEEFTYYFKEENGTGTFKKYSDEEFKKIALEDNIKQNKKENIQSKDKKFVQGTKIGNNKKLAENIKASKNSIKGKEKNAVEIKKNNFDKKDNTVINDDISTVTDAISSDVFKNPGKRDLKERMYLKSSFDTEENNIDKYFSSSDEEKEE